MTTRCDEAPAALAGRKGFEEWRENSGDEVVAAALIERRLRRCNIGSIGKETVDAAPDGPSKGRPALEGRERRTHQGGRRTAGSVDTLTARQSRRPEVIRRQESDIVGLLSNPGRLRVVPVSTRFGCAERNDKGGAGRALARCGCCHRPACERGPGHGCGRRPRDSGTPGVPNAAPRAGSAEESYRRSASPGSSWWSWRVAGDSVTRGEPRADGGASSGRRSRGSAGSIETGRGPWMAAFHGRRSAV
jgi:hypothetical protein